MSLNQKSQVRDNRPSFSMGGLPRSRGKPSKVSLPKFSFELGCRSAVERGAVNAVVGGSSPPAPAKTIRR